MRTIVDSPDVSRDQLATKCSEKSKLGDETWICGQTYLAMKALRAPLAASIGTGLIASVCCGGSLVFASIGMGSLYGTLALWKFVPQVLAAGALCIVTVNYLVYRRHAKRRHSAGVGHPGLLRQAMLLSATVGIVGMVGSFLFLEWLNHGVVNGRLFLTHPDYAQSIIPGVPNVRLLYAAASFAALGLLRALPFPGDVSSHPDGPAARRQALLRAGLFVSGAAVMVVLLGGGLGLVGSGTPDSQSGHNTQQHHGSSHSGS